MRNKPCDCQIHFEKGPLFTRLSLVCEAQALVSSLAREILKLRGPQKPYVVSARVVSAKTASKDHPPEELRL